MSTDVRQTWAIGHDGSDGATHATAWALRQVAGRGVDVMLVRSWQIPPLDFPLPADSIEGFAPARVCENVDDVVAAGKAAGAAVSQHIVRGPSAHVLLEASDDASLLVVGSRGHGGFKRLLLGSVSSQCATHARVPTIVVPASSAVDRAVARIVVGLDGSDRARSALEWAIDFAPEGCEIVVVGAWMPSKSGYTAVVEHYTNELEHARTQFNAVLDGIEAEAGSTLFERHFSFAEPVGRLLDEAENADLLVVGQRGHSGLSGAILGSVTTHVLHHSPIPVAVVPVEEHR